MQRQTFSFFSQNVWELLFGNLVEVSHCRKNVHWLPWKILEATERHKMTKYLSRACGSWAKEGLIKPEVLSVLRSHVHSGDNSNYAWLLLGLLSGHVALDDPRFVQVRVFLRILQVWSLCNSILFYWLLQPSIIVKSVHSYKHTNKIDVRQWLGTC